MATSNSDVGAQNASIAPLLASPTVQPTIREARGPRVWDETFTATDNGIDPSYKDKPGV